MIIRTATPKDVSAIRNCAKAAYTRYIPTIGRPPAPMVADFDELVAKGHVKVAGIDEIKGFIVFFAQGNQMMLDGLAVHPDHARSRRAGMSVGRAIYQ